MSSDADLAAYWARFFGLVDALRKSIEPCPAGWEPKMDAAVQLRRRGEYVKAAQIYFDLMEDSGTVYTAALAELYKVLVSACQFLPALSVLQLGQVIYANAVDPSTLSSRVPSVFEIHSVELLAATQGEPELLAYLARISDNPDYRLPDDFATLARDCKNAASVLAMAAGPKKSGCYIATAVYGSYEAPPVLVLRRYRDETLAKTARGRLFIRLYYAAGPTAARYVGDRAILKRASRRVLDGVVRRLDARG